MVLDGVEATGVVLATLSTLVVLATGVETGAAELGVEKYDTLVAEARLEVTAATDDETEAALPSFCDSPEQRVTVMTESWGQACIP